MIPFAIFILFSSFQIQKSSRLKLKDINSVHQAQKFQSETSLIQKLNNQQYQNSEQQNLKDFQKNTQQADIKIIQINFKDKNVKSVKSKNQSKLQIQNVPQPEIINENIKIDVNQGSILNKKITIIADDKSNQQLSENLQQINPQSSKIQNFQESPIPTFLGGLLPLSQNQQSYTFMPVIKGQSTIIAPNNMHFEDLPLAKKMRYTKKESPQIKSGFYGISRVTFKKFKK